MMKYKLVKDLPTFEIGNIFELDDWGLWLLRGDRRIVQAYAMTTINKFPRILNEFFEKIEDTPTRWRAEDGKSYYYITAQGRVDIDGEVSDKEYSNLRYDFGNYFQTKEQAEQARDFFKAWRTLKDDTKSHIYTKSSMKWYVFYDTESDLGISYSSMNIYHSILFATREDAEASIKAHHKEWLTFLGVKEGE